MATYTMHVFAKTGYHLINSTYISLQNVHYCWDTLYMYMQYEYLEIPPFVDWLLENGDSLLVELVEKRRFAGADVALDGDRERAINRIVPHLYRDCSA